MGSAHQRSDLVRRIALDALKSHPRHADLTDEARVLVDLALVLLPVVIVLVVRDEPLRVQAELLHLVNQRPGGRSETGQRTTDRLQLLRELVRLVPHRKRGVEQFLLLRSVIDRIQRLEGVVNVPARTRIPEAVVFSAAACVSKVSRLPVKVGIFPKSITSWGPSSLPGSEPWSTPPACSSPSAGHP